jgi:hypothetical protein
MNRLLTSLQVFCAATLIVSGVLIVARADSADENSTSDERAIDRAEVDSLIRQLGSAKRTTRTEAEKNLKAFGPAVLDFLPPADLIRSVAAKQAVRRIRIRLEDEAARQSLKPRRVTLRGSFGIEEVIKEISEQTGNALVLAKSTDAENTQLPMLKIDWRNVTFWGAVLRLEDNGWLVRFDPQSGDLIVSRAGSLPLKVTANREAFRIRVAPLTQKTIGDGELLLQTRVSIECEPRLRPLFLNYASDDLSLKLKSKTAASFDAGAKIELPLGVSGREAVFQPRFLAEHAAETADLNGKVSMLLAAAERPIEFLRLGEATGVARRRGGVTVVVSSVRFDEKDDRHSARVQIRVSYDLGTNAFESHQTWVFHNRVWLTAKSGATDAERTAPKSFDTLFQNESGVGIEYVFSDLKQDPKGMSFVYLAPTQLIRVPVELNIAGLPIIDD